MVPYFTRAIYKGTPHPGSRGLSPSDLKPKTQNLTPRMYTP